MAMFWNRKGKEEVRADTALTEPAVDNVLLKSLLGKDVVTKSMALEIPTVTACISLIASKVQMCPFRLYRQDGDHVIEIKNDSRLRMLNKDTGDTMTATQFWNAIIEDYFLGRGAYAYIGKDGARYDKLYYVNEENVSTIKTEHPIFKDYRIIVQGYTYYPFEFVKFLRDTKDGCTSKPMQETTPTQFALSYNELIFENSLVKKGGNKRGFLKSQRKLVKEAIDALKNAFRMLYSNNSDENVVVLNDGVDFVESSATSVEMQLNENKITNAAEIAKLFKVPVSVLEGKGTSEDNYSFVTNAVIPVLNDIEASLDRDLLTEDEKLLGYYFAADTRELTRGSLKERYEAYEIALRNNFLQIDEVRNKEDEEPLGIAWLTMGLDKVLYNPQTHEIYTPNTNQWVKLTEITQNGGEQIENRT